MAIFETLAPSERARQLANPEGAVGLAVADWLNENDKQGNAKAVDSGAADWHATGDAQSSDFIANSQM